MGKVICKIRIGVEDYVLFYVIVCVLVLRWIMRFCDLSRIFVCEVLEVVVWVIIVSVL